MSLSNPSLTNPAQHFFEWKGGEGKLQFYDKEKQQNIAVPVPFTFIVLDQLHTITGYDKQAQSGFWSNEIRNIRTEDLTVRTKTGVKYVGPYKNEQGIVQMPKGAGYTKSIYIAHQNKAGDWIMGNLKVAGSALTAWIEFTQKHAVDAGKITMQRGEKQTSPVGDFYPPSFTWSKWDDKEFDAAVELDKQLQTYLSQYLTAPKYDDNAEPVNDWDVDEGKATPEEVEDFNKKFEAATSKPEPVTATAKRPVDEVFENIDDTPVSLDDIPF